MSLLLSQLGGGTTYNVSLSDTATISDTVTKAVTSVKTDSVTLTESLSKSVSNFRSDSVTTADSIVKSFSAVKQDNVTVADSVSKSIGLTKEDSIALVEALTKEIRKTGVDTVSINDLLQSAQNFVRNLADAVTATDIVLKQIGIIREDSVNTADDLNRQINVNKQDLISLIDLLISNAPPEVPTVSEVRGKQLSIGVQPHDHTKEALEIDRIPIRSIDEQLFTRQLIDEDDEIFCIINSFLLCH